MAAGVLVAVEGIDGAGKTTQVAALTERLQAADVPVVRTKEPTDGPLGRAIRATATTGRLPVSEELQLFLDDRREHVAQLIRPALRRGDVVIVDRYYYSTAAYQGARGLDADAIIDANEAFAPRPDLLILVEIDPEVGLQRVRRRDTEENLFERLDDLRRCKEIFDRIEGDHVLRIDGSQSPEAITAALVEALAALLPAEAAARLRNVGG